MRFLLALLLLIGCGCSDSKAQEPPAANAAAGLELTGRVVDAANLLDARAEQALTRRSSELEAATKDQLVVVTLASLGGRPIEEVSLELATRWGVGQADLDNGVLLLVAPNEKKVRIDVGYGLEGLVTDERAGTIIQAMLPKFRQGDLPGAILVGAEQLDTLLRSDRRRPQYAPEQQQQKKAA